MPKLSDFQVQLLTEANDDDTGAISAPAEHKPAVAGLIKRGFFIALPQADGPNRLLITDAGRAAIAGDQGKPGSPKEGVLQTPPTSIEAVGEVTLPEAETVATKPPSKLQLLADLLRRPGGAGVEEMMAATGWQAHSVRGALSGSLKKAMGLAVISEPSDQGRRYRIADAAAAGATA